MKQLAILSAAALSVGLLTIQDAAAQRRGGGASVRTGAVAFGGATMRITRSRAAAAQPTFLGARSTVVRTSPAAHRGAAFGHRDATASRHGIDPARIRSGHAMGASLRAPVATVARHSHRRWLGPRWGFGLPVAAVAIGPLYDDAANPSFGDCQVWDGAAWVDACNGPAGYEEP